MWAVCTVCRSRSRSLVHEPQRVSAARPIITLQPRGRRCNPPVWGTHGAARARTRHERCSRASGSSSTPCSPCSGSHSSMGCASQQPRRRRRRASHPRGSREDYRHAQYGRPHGRSSRGTPSPSWSTSGRDFECCFEVRLRARPPRDAGALLLINLDQIRGSRARRSWRPWRATSGCWRLRVSGSRMSMTARRPSSDPGLRSRWVRPTCTGASTLRGWATTWQQPVGEVARGARSQQSPDDMPGWTARSGPQSVRRRGADGSIRAQTDARSRKEQVTSRRGESREDPPDVGGPEPHLRRPPGSALVETGASATDSGP